MRINHKTPDKTVQIDMTIAKLIFILIPITSALLDSQTSKDESFDVVKTVVSEFINRFHIIEISEPLFCSRN